MDYTTALLRLEYLRDLVERYLPQLHESGEARQLLHQEICEVYGEVSEVYRAVAGVQKVEVPSHRGLVSTYANFFEAGFLSGRTIHTHQGKTELMRVIGQVKTRTAAPVVLETDTKMSAGNRVFVVHGHDESSLQQCARFLEKLKLQAVVLREQPNRGRTIIEKFVDYSDVAFAVVLLTPDDRGGAAGAAETDYRPRARQNVILELGFFLGLLGRGNVCALYSEGVEIPSDYQGVAFVPLDSRLAWRLELGRELRAAGLPVDLNDAV